MFPENIGYLSIIISLVAAFFYIRDIFLGKTKPNKVSWFIWSLAPLIGAFFQFKEGATLSALAVFMGGFIAIMVFTISLFYKDAYWKIATLDMICGALSIFAVVLWILTRNSSVSIVFAILSDGLASVPTLIKSWKFPETETGLMYLLCFFNALIGLSVIKVWSFPIYSFGVYLAVQTLLTAMGIYRKKIILAFS